MEHNPNGINNIHNIPNINVGASSILKNKYDFSRKQSDYLYNPNIITGKPEIAKNEIIYIFIYSVNTSGAFPFLEILLYKTFDKTKPQNDMCILPFFKVKQKKNVLKESTKYTDEVFSEWNHKPTYKGYLNNNKKTVLIYEKKHENALVSLTKRDTKWWWVIPAEIINECKTLNFPIQSDVRDFLLEHQSLNHIYDSAKNIYESPVIYYHGSDYNSITYMSIFGIKKSRVSARLGPYYYYSTYNRELRHSIWSQTKKPMYKNNKLITINEFGKYKRGGLIKVALFAGKTKALLNRKDDPIDKSDVSKEKASKDLFIKNTLKMRDVNGIWTNQYNSVFTGKYDIMGNKKITTHYPHMVVQSYNQQMPLNYYYIDTEEAPEDRVRELNLYIQ